MNYSDEELQQKIERKDPIENTADARAYQKVFEALEKEPYYLPINFADRVMGRLEATNNGLSGDYFWLGLGLLSFIVATAITAAITRFRIDWGALRFLSGYSGLFIFGVAFVLFLQWIDKKLVQKQLQPRR